MASIGRASLLHWRTAANGPGDIPQDVLAAVCQRLRQINAANGSREISIALQRCEEAILWLDALDRRKANERDSSA